MKGIIWIIAAMALLTSSLYSDPLVRTESAKNGEMSECANDSAEVYANPQIKTITVVKIDPDPGMIEIMDMDAPTESHSIGYISSEEFKFTDRSGAEFAFIVNDDKTVSLSSGDANGVETLVIPSSVEGPKSVFRVSKINSFAFSKSGISGDVMAGVKHLVISEGITSVGQNCFANASSLETASLPASLRNISYSMFSGCANLKQVEIPEETNLVEIGELAFKDCKSLESFYIPGSVNKIGKCPWRGCRSLEKISLADENCEFVEQDGVLYSDWQGNLIQYPAGKKDREYTPLFGTKAIDNSAFYGNPYIEKVILPASLNSIDSYAFDECISLREVIFNNKIERIWNNAFTNCPKLGAVTLYGDPEYIIGSGPNNSFGDNTKVSISPNVPPVMLEKSDLSTLSSAAQNIIPQKLIDAANVEIKANIELNSSKFFTDETVAVMKKTQIELRQDSVVYEHVCTPNMLKTFKGMEDLKEKIFFIQRRSQFSPNFRKLIDLSYNNIITSLKSVNCGTAGF